MIGVVAEHRASVWNAVNGARLRFESPSQPVNAIALSPDGARVAVANDAEIVMTRVDTGKTEWDIKPDGSDFPTLIQFSPDGSKLLTSGGFVAVYDAANGARILHKPDEPQGWFAVFAGDGARIAALRFGSLTVLDSATREALYAPYINPGLVNTQYAMFLPGDKDVALFGVHRIPNAGSATTSALASSVLAPQASSYRVVIVDLATDKTLTTIDAPFFN